MNEEVIRELGRGAYGTVFLKRIQGKLYAVKTQPYYINPDVRRNPFLEIDALRKLNNSPLVVNLFNVSIIGTEISLYLEHMDMTVTEYVRNTTQEVRKNIFPHFFRTMLEILAVLECNEINHYDIKPDNILVKLPSTFKLSDFGIAQGIYKGDFSGDLYTLAYRPPEYLTNVQSIPPFVSDVWAMAITIRFFFDGKVLFNLPKEQIMKAIERNSSSGKYIHNTPLESKYKVYLELMTIVNPQNRFRASVILSRMDNWAKTNPPTFPDPPRKIKVELLSHIFKMNQILQRSPLVYVMTVELIGRFINNVGCIPPAYLTYVMICHYLASIYLDNPQLSITSIERAYNNPISPLDLQRGIVFIIGNINQIYNPHLTKRIKRIQNISSYDEYHYMKPVSQWF